MIAFNFTVDRTDHRPPVLFWRQMFVTVNAFIMMSVRVAGSEKLKSFAILITMANNGPASVGIRRTVGEQEEGEWKWANCKVDLNRRVRQMFTFDYGAICRLAEYAGFLEGKLVPSSRPSWTADESRGGQSASVATWDTESHWGLVLKRARFLNH